MIKNLVLFSLITALVLQTFSKTWLFIAYKLNQEYIAKTLCINVNKPEVMCSGKCYLNNKIQDDDEQHGSHMPFNLKNQKDIVYHYSSEIIYSPISKKTYLCPISQIQVFIESIYTDGVFHPPNFTA